MKILIVTNLYPPHHAGTYDLRCQEVVDALRTRGHELMIVTSNHGLNTEQWDGEIVRRFILNGRFGHPEISGFRDMLKLETQNHTVLREALEAFAPDLIYCWSLIGLSKSLIVTAREFQRPVVYDVADGWMAEEFRFDPWLRWWNSPGTNLTRGGLELSGQRNRYEAVAPTRLVPGYDRAPEIFGPPKVIAQVPPNSISICRFDRIIFCSQSLKIATEQAGFQVGHGEVIYPGIATETFLGELKPLGTPIRKLLIVSPLIEGSGVMSALKALKLARENGVKISLSIYGRGESDYVSQLRSFVVQFQLPVEFLTVSNMNRDLAAVYRQHEAFLYTSELEEPFVRTPLEAMAGGLPVIGAFSGAMRELVRHGENGLIYTPGDTTELLSRIQELQMQPALRRQMAETAQAEVSATYSDTVMIDKIENYLNLTAAEWGPA